MKTLRLLRHAKSDWSDPGLHDHDRPLNARGKRTRALVAEHVQGWPVELVVCSTARRARETAKPVVKALGCPVTYDERIYDAEVHALLTVVRELPDTVDDVLLVGHNPGFEELTQALCGTTPRYPTGALGTIELDVEHWADVRQGSGRLAAHVTPAVLEPRDG